MNFFFLFFTHFVFFLFFSSFYCCSQKKFLDKRGWGILWTRPIAVDSWDCLTIVSVYLCNTEIQFRNRFVRL